MACFGNSAVHLGWALQPSWSQNHWGWKRASVPPALFRAESATTGLLHTRSSSSLNISKDGYSTSLDNLFQCLITLTINPPHFLYSNNFMYSSLCPLSGKLWELSSNPFIPLLTCFYTLMRSPWDFSPPGFFFDRCFKLLIICIS